MTDGEHSDVGMHSLIEQQRDSVNRTGTFCDQEAARRLAPSSSSANRQRDLIASTAGMVSITGEPHRSP